MDDEESGHAQIKISTESPLMTCGPQPSVRIKDTELPSNVAKIGTEEDGKD